MNNYFRWFGLPGSLVLTALLSLTALTLALVFRTPDRWLRLAAMLFSSLGDVILMSYAPIVSRLPYSMRGFLGGGGAFVVAHLFYAAAFLWLLRERGAGLANPGLWVGLVVTVLIAGVLFALFVRSGQKEHLMFVYCLIYVLVIGANLTLSFTYAVAAGGSALLFALGAISFVVSDFFIGLDVLGKCATPATEGLIWWFYPIGQILLLLP